MKKLSILLILTSVVVGCSHGITVPETDYQANIRWEKKVAEELDTGEESVRNRGNRKRTGIEQNLSKGSIALETLLSLLEERHPELIALRRKREAALEAARQAGGWPDPMLKAKYGEQPLQTRDGPVDWRAQLQQTIPWFGKLDAAQKAKLAEAGQASARLRERTLQLRRELTKAYYDYYYQIRAVSITNEMISSLDHLVESVRSSYEDGSVPRQDVLKAEIDRDDLRTRRSDHRDLRKEARSRINSLLDRRADASLGTPEPDMEIGEIPDRQRLVEAARTHHPDRNRTVFEVLQHRQGAREARLDYLPDITAGVMYHGVGHTDQMGTVDAGQDAREFILGLNLPLWTGKRDARLRKHKLRMRAARMQLRDVDNRIQSRIDGALASLRNHRRRFRFISQTALPKAQEALSSSREAYRNGEVGITDVLNAETALLQFRLEKENVIGSYRTARKKLEEVIGLPLGDL